LGETNIPKNDAFTDALELPSENSTNYGNTELATSEETEPLPNQTDDYRTLWYRIRLDRDANVIINADTRFKVFKGNALSNLELVDRVSSLRWQNTDIYQLHQFFSGIILCLRLCCSRKSVVKLHPANSPNRNR